MQGQRLLGHPPRVIKIDAGGDAAWKVGKRDAVVAAGVLVDQRNVLPRGYLSLIWACRSMLPGLDAGR
jgi:hypothetical protein